MKYTSTTRSSKRSNRIIEMMNGKYFQLQKIVNVRTKTHENACIGIGNKFKAYMNEPDCNMFQIVFKNLKLRAIDLNLILGKKFILYSDNYCITMPNCVELD